ncbi:hypothetical protein LZ554_006350 [Drepanopeziza brunnea f. sp. 'monogermtubi']|nr:hypothetical protein LZ554_006350 [Drepanopeziza brunnea f. sp. 'monogermtubi']
MIIVVTVDHTHLCSVLSSISTSQLSSAVLPVDPPKTSSIIRFFTVLSFCCGRSAPLFGWAEQSSHGKSGGALLQDANEFDSNSFLAAGVLFNSILLNPSLVLILIYSFLIVAPTFFGRSPPFKDSTLRPIFRPTLPYE